MADNIHQTTAGSNSKSSSISASKSDETKPNEHYDRLRALNEAAGAGAATVDDDATQWLPLESNPDILNTFAKDVGLSHNKMEFVDILCPGMYPSTQCLAFLLLFPCTENIYKFRQQEAIQIRKEQQQMSCTNNSGHSNDDHSNLCFIKQVEAFGNACGTIACLHICLNTDGAISNTSISTATSSTDPYNDSKSSSSSPLQSFYTATKHCTPEERGNILLQTQNLKTCSDISASSSIAQTNCPLRDGPDLDHHFVSFVQALNEQEQQLHLYELDGTKQCPIDHGPTSNSTFENDTWNIIRQNFMNLEPDSIEFSLLALIRRPSS